MHFHALRIALFALAVATTQVWAQTGPSVTQIGTETLSVAEPYFKAYIARDWDRLELLLAGNGGFADPTATLVFGPVKHEGKAATLKNFRENYATISHMEFHRTRTLVFGEHAIYEGTLDWTLQLKGGKTAVTRGMPFITILRVVEGRVLEHRDFADYTPFLAAMRASQTGG